MSAEDQPLDAFDCPRCGASVTERFWGPCAPCREQLVRAYQAEAPGPDGPAALEATRFEPAMHVVPNHVATKD